MVSLMGGMEEGNMLETFMVFAGLIILVGIPAFAKLLTEWYVNQQ